MEQKLFHTIEALEMQKHDVVEGLLKSVDNYATGDGNAWRLAEKVFEKAEELASIEGRLETLEDIVNGS